MLFEGMFGRGSGSRDLRGDSPAAVFRPCIEGGRLPKDCEMALVATSDLRDVGGSGGGKGDVEMSVTEAECA